MLMEHQKRLDRFFATLLYDPDAGFDCGAGCRISALHQCRDDDCICLLATVSVDDERWWLYSSVGGLGRPGRGLLSVAIGHGEIAGTDNSATQGSLICNCGRVGCIGTSVEYKKSDIPFGLSDYTGRPLSGDREAFINFRMFKTRQCAEASIFDMFSHYLHGDQSVCDFASILLTSALFPFTFLQLSAQMGSLFRIPSGTQTFSDWVEEESSMDRTVWDFAVEVWKPLFGKGSEGLAMPALREHDSRGATAFCNYLHCRRVSGSDVVAAWGRGQEYSFKRFRAVSLFEVDDLSELQPGPSLPKGHRGVKRRLRKADR